MNTDEFILNDYKYTVKSLPLLAEPLTTSRMITMVAPYSKLQVVASHGDWVKINYHEQEGYIAKERLSITKETLVTARLKPQPKEKMKSMGKIPKNTRIEVIESYGEWYQIFDGDRLGYLLSTQVGECQIPVIEETTDDKAKKTHRPKPKAPIHFNLFK